MGSTNCQSGYCFVALTFLPIDLVIQVYTNKQMFVRVYLDPRQAYGTNSEKSLGVVWKNLAQGIPESHQTFPRGAVPKESLMTRGNSCELIFQTIPEDFPLFFRLGL